MPECACTFQKGNHSFLTPSTQTRTTHSVCVCVQVCVCARVLQTSNQTADQWRIFKQTLFSFPSTPLLISLPLMSPINKGKYLLSSSICDLSVFALKIKQCASFVGCPHPHRCVDACVHKWLFSFLLLFMAPYQLISAPRATRSSATQAEDSKDS